MDKTNIIAIYEELQAAMPDENFMLTFLSDRNLGAEPTVQIAVRSANNISVTLYLTEQECQEFTVLDLIKDITFLISQEKYRRTIIFATALQGVIDNANTHKE